MTTNARFALAVIISSLWLSACQKEAPHSASSDESAKSQVTSSAQFGQPDIPFTFSYPTTFLNDASVSFHLKQGENGPEAGPPNYELQIDEHDGIHIRQAAAAEVSNERLSASAEKFAQSANGKLDNVETHNCGGRKLVFIDADFNFPTQPPLPGHSKSYMFGYGGKTWQVEFFSSTQTGLDAASSARSLFCSSVSFR